MDKSITTPSTPTTGIASGVDYLGTVRAELQENPGLLGDTVAPGAEGHHGIGVPTPKAQQPRPTNGSGFFTSPGCVGHDSLYGGLCGASQDAPEPLAGTPTCTVCPPRLASREAGFEPVPKEPIMADTTTPKQSTGTTTSTHFTPEGTPKTILGQIHSTRRGTLLLTHISDTPMVLKSDQLIVWGLGYGQWYLTLGHAVPVLKLRTLAETEGIDFDGLIRLRDEVAEVLA